MGNADGICFGITIVLTSILASEWFWRLFWFLAVRTLCYNLHMAKKTFLQMCAAAGVASAILAFPAAAREPFRFPRATPESQGIRSTAVSEFVRRLNAEGDMAHAYMLIRHGKVVAEGCWAPYDANVPHALYSISKAFTSMAIGYAVDDRKMTLNDRVDWFFPEYAPTNSPGHARELRVRDLMQMASGHRRDPLSAARSSSETNWPKAFYAAPVPDPPGLVFRYMTGNSCMLAQIHRRVTGAADMIDYLRPRLFDKLDIADMYWDRQPDGTVFGGSGFHLRAEDLAKVAQLLLQGGVWRGERILPLWWVKQATSCQTPYGSVMDPVLALHLGAKDAKGLPDPANDWQQGYGFQMWMGRHETFRLCGAYGQIGVVMPNEDVVCVVLAGGNGSNKLSADALYDTILPSLSAVPLPEDPAALASLRSLSASLSITLPEHSASPSPETLKAAERIYAFPENVRGVKSIKFSPSLKTIDIENGFGRQTGRWVCGSVATDPVSTKATNVIPGGPQPVGAAGAWTAPDAYRVRVCYLSAPHIMTIDLRFSDGALSATFDCPLAGIKRQSVVGR